MKTLLNRPVAVAGAASLGALALIAVVYVAIPDREPAAEAFDLSTQPAETAAHYRYVESEPELFAAVPCYCGCGASLGHTSLLDCFVKPDGSGYDEHASLCMICLSEAEDVRRLRGEGSDPASIRAWIHREYGKYGPPTETNP